MWDLGKIFSRWILSTANFLILFPSLIVISVGLILRLVPVHMTKLLTHLTRQCNIQPQLQQFLLTAFSLTSIKELGLTLVFISSLFIIPSMVGYIGAVRHSKVCLVLYLIPLITLWTMELVTLIIFPAVKPFIIACVEKLLQWTLSHYSAGGREGPNLTSLGWDHVMVAMQCCGINSHSDFTNSSLWMATKNNMQVIPESCCITDTEKYPLIEAFDGHCVYVPTKYNSHWTQGCLPSATSQLSQHLPVIILILVIVIFVQLLAITAALCLLCLHSNSCKHQQTVIVRNLNKRSDEESC